MRFIGLKHYLKIGPHDTFVICFLFECIANLFVNLYLEKGRKAGEKEKKKGRRTMSDDDEIPKAVRKKIKTQAVIP